MSLLTVHMKDLRRRPGNPNELGYNQLFTTWLLSCAGHGAAALDLIRMADDAKIKTFAMVGGRDSE